MAGLSALPAWTSHLPSAPDIDPPLPAGFAAQVELEKGIDALRFFWDEHLRHARDKGVDFVLSWHCFLLNGAGLAFPSLHHRSIA